ncbi:MAG TPA: helix-turn-helix domain-containing protein [Rhizomicrobium sp.]|nr:helix-turn-helix domain-containing protein [Rhizomicrobium sp.]
MGILPAATVGLDAAGLPPHLFPFGIADDVAAPVTLADCLASLPAVTQRQCSRNETVFLDGDPVDCVMAVAHGAVRHCRYAPDGRRHISDFSFAGDVIGLLECPDQPAAAEAVTDVTLLSWPRAAFDRLAARDMEVRQRMLCHLTAAHLDAQRHLFVLGCLSAKERVAAFLLRLADRLGVAPGRRIAIPMCRQDIADHLGLTVETVCRAITHLRNLGAVCVPGPRHLILTDMPKLRALAIES